MALTAGCSFGDHLPSRVTSSVYPQVGKSSEGVSHLQIIKSGWFIAIDMNHNFQPLRRSQMEVIPQVRRWTVFICCTDDPTGSTWGLSFCRFPETHLFLYIDNWSTMIIVVKQLLIDVIINFKACTVIFTKSLPIPLHKWWINLVGKS